MPVPNPFIPNKPASDQKALSGRRRELRLLLSYLLDTEHPQSCVIIGPPFIGKTSLLAHLLARQHAQTTRRSDTTSIHAERLARTIQILLPMSDLTTAHIDRFYQRLFQEARRRLLDLAKQGFPALSIPSRTPAGDPSTPLDRLHDLLHNASASGYRFHFLLDNFTATLENPAAFNDAFFTQLRSCAQQYNVAWLITSDRPPLSLWDAADIARAPFFSLLRRITLGLLPDDEADALLEETSQRASHPFTPDERAALLRLAGPHPAFLQLAGWHFYESRFMRRLPSRSALSDATYRYTEAANPLYSALWERLNSAERQALLANLAAIDHPDTSAPFPTPEQEEILQSLAHHQALLRQTGERTRYLPFGEGFATFLRNLPPDSARTDEDEYNDFARLARQACVSNEDQAHIQTALDLFRQGRYEPGLRTLFPSLENIAGALVQQRARHPAPQQLGPRIEALHHAGAISQETFTLAMRLIRERINATHGYTIADARHVARSAVILGRRLLQEASNLA